ncbi:hypothetical protein SEA_MAGRITTE_63 [Microbacterium phage Magritte]|nr:hypothetical protein SEA_MAGRITTE_63 [Microbacterium phage Magritte]
MDWREMHKLWAASEERKIAEAEALRMWPKNYHMGRWDGTMSQDEIDQRMSMQRNAYVMGERAAFVRAHGGEEVAEDHG